MGNLIVITMFFTVIMYADSCQECYYNVGDYATCLGEEVCVYGAKYVEVECWLRSVKTDVVIEQLLVRGDCGNVSQFRTFCKQGVKAVKMITSDDSLSCSSKNFFFVFCLKSSTNYVSLHPLSQLFIQYRFIASSKIRFLKDLLKQFSTKVGRKLP